MIGQQFSKLLNDPGLVNDQSLILLHDIVSRYPYCQSGQLLLACNYYAEKNNQYPNQLKKAAAYAGDRRILKELVGRVKKADSIQQPYTAVAEPVSRILYKEPEMPAIELTTQVYERLTQEDLLAIVKKRLAEIDAEKKREQKISDLPDPEFPGPLPASPVTKSSLIEKFIREEPRISKPKAAFFNPNDSAIRSNFDEEEIVSETLAQLYAQQGNIQKAMHIYEKLSLINQEKSRYFAAQIEKLSS